LTAVYLTVFFYDDFIRSAKKYMAYSVMVKGGNMGIGKFILSLYKWHKLSDRNLLVMRAKVDRQIDGFTELEIRGGLTRGAEKDLNAAHRALREIDEEMEKRGL